MRSYSDRPSHVRPSPAAHAAAHAAASRAHHAPLRLRLGFVNLRYVLGFRTSPQLEDDATGQLTLGLDTEADSARAYRPGGIQPVTADWRPPLCRLLRRTGGLDAVAVKLALSAIWLARASPHHEVAEPAATWAELLDLPAPATSGARRVRGAMATLEEFRLVDTVSHPPRPTLLRLRREDGTGRGYTLPDPGGSGTADYFFRVPSVLWSGGWLAGLSGPALTVLLIVLSRRDFDAPSSPVWLTQRQLREEHRITYRTWWEGVRELEAFDLLDRYTSTRVSGGRYQSRTKVSLRDDRLDEGLSPDVWAHVQSARAERSANRST